MAGGARSPRGTASRRAVGSQGRGGTARGWAMRRPGFVAGLVAVLAAGSVGSVGPFGPFAAAPARADEGGAWRRPVPGAVVRPFVEPASAYGPGHRGVDLAAAPGTPVGAAGPGTVTFSGPVAGALHVVVGHRGGVRTSYSFLLDVAVAVGDPVVAGTPVGRAGGPDPDHVGVVHFGVRLGDRYVDPMRLFADAPARIRLVPVDGATADRRPAPDEAGGLLAGLADPGGSVGPPDPERGCGPGVPGLDALARAVCGGIDWAAARTGEALRAGLGLLAGAGRTGRILARTLADDLAAARAVLARGSAAAIAALADHPVVRVLRDLVEMGERFLDWTRRECDTDAPPADGTGGSGHLLLAVAGIDSRAAGPGRRSFGLDTAALGYHDDEVHWFSYADDGGAYAPADTHDDLRVAARRLAAQLRAIDAAEPGREVDLIAHSQGGVVVEQFLRHEYDASDPTFPPIGTVVTLASPHRGAPLATTARTLRRHPRAGPLLDRLGPVLPGPPADARSVAQLAEDSAFLERMRMAPLPEHVALTTVGGTDDVVVPADRIRVPGATEVVVTVDGLGDHGAIPRDPRALQVVRSALEQRPPPCTAVLEGLRGAITPVLLGRVERGLGEHLTDVLGPGPLSP
jgi:hypothetical protein